jgi:DNA-directed RNA polymerase specialized sigma24 family protein
VIFYYAADLFRDAGYAVSDALLNIVVIGLVNLAFTVVAVLCVDRFGRKRLMMLMTRHQRQIFGYIYALVPNRYDAEDLLQETSLVICEKFNEFEDGTDFVAWACQIAYWRIRYSRQIFARSKVVFIQEILDAVAQTAKWQPAPHPSSKEVFDYLRKRSSAGASANPFADQVAQAKKALKRTYHVAYVQHAPLETRTALAEWTDGKLTVYASDRSGEGNLDLWLQQIPGGQPVRLTHEKADA